MGKPIEQEFRADIRQFLTQMQRMGLSFDDLQKELADVAQDSDTMERRLTGNLEQIQREARTTGDRLDRDLQIDRSGSAREGASEVGSELAENLSEGFQSGDFLGVATETAASLTQGLSQTLGPAGVVAGIGAGVVGLLVHNIQAKSDRIRELGLQIGEELASAMQDGLNEQELRTTVVEALKTTLEDTGSSLGEFKAQAEAAGLGWDDVIRNLSAGGPGLDKLKQRLWDLSQETRTWTGANGQANTTQTERAKSAEALLTTLNEVGDGTQKGIANAIAEADALDGSKKSSDDYRRSLDLLQKKMRGFDSNDELVQWLASNGKAARRSRKDIEDYLVAVNKAMQPLRPENLWGGTKRSHVRNRP